MYMFMYMYMYMFMYMYMYMCIHMLNTFILWIILVGFLQPSTHQFINIHNDPLPLLTKNKQTLTPTTCLLHSYTNNPTTCFLPGSTEPSAISARDETTTQSATTAMGANLPPARSHLAACVHHCLAQTERRGLPAGAYYAGDNTSHAAAGGVPTT
jgi:hypothetical protein